METKVVAAQHGITAAVVYYMLGKGYQLTVMDKQQYQSFLWEGKVSGTACADGGEAIAAMLALKECTLVCTNEGDAVSFGFTYGTDWGFDCLDDLEYGGNFSPVKEAVLDQVNTLRQYYVDHYLDWRD